MNFLFLIVAGLAALVLFFPSALSGLTGTAM